MAEASYLDSPLYFKYIIIAGVVIQVRIYWKEDFLYVFFVKEKALFLTCGDVSSYNKPVDYIKQCFQAVGFIETLLGKLYGVRINPLNILFGAAARQGLLKRRLSA